MERVKLTKPGGSYFSSPKRKISFIPTGCKTLDLALGGGWTEGRIANIVGDKSTGKSLLCIEACSNFAIKHPKGKIFYRESEAAFDPGYAKALGMPIERVEFGDPFETVEDMFNDIDFIIKKTKGPVLYIMDSLDALSDRAELDRDIGTGSYGAEKAKKMSQLFRRLVRNMSERMACLIVSQVRDKFGVMIGRKTTRTGGRALDFYASHVIYLQQTGRINKTVRGIKRPTAIRVRAQVDKNKISLPLREASFPITFGFGIDDMTACLEWLDEVGGLKPITGGMKIRDYVQDKLNGHGMIKYRTELAKIHEIVETLWYEIESEFIPKHTKYGG